jgi:hypothetical protein
MQLLIMFRKSLRTSVRDVPRRILSASLSNLSCVSRLIIVNSSGTFRPVVGVTLSSILAPDFAAMSALCRVSFSAKAATIPWMVRGKSACP